MTAVYSVPDTRRWPNVDLLLDHRLRRWPNSKSTLDQNLVFAEMLSESIRASGVRIDVRGKKGRLSAFVFQIYELITDIIMQLDTAKRA